MQQTTSSYSQVKPLAKMCLSFPDAYQKGNGWWTHDDNPHFDFWESEEGNIRIKSWTGRTDDDILSMGCIPLSRADLYAKPGQWSRVQVRDKLDLLTLADYMALDWQFLTQEGYRDGYPYTYSNGNSTRCVKVGGYCTSDGKEHTKHQVRLSLHKEPRFLWNQNTPGEIIPCGLHYLDRARAAGYLFIGEGGSDFATMTFHGLPFIGIPGAENAKKLDVSLLEGIPVVYILEEPDQVKKLQEQGQGFYKNMRSHLRDNSYTGQIFSIRFLEATGYKDPSDLHKAIHRACKEQAEGPFRQEVHKRFIQAIETAIEQAIPEGNEDILKRSPGQRDWSKIDFETFSCKVWAVPAAFLSPIQKIILCYIFRYMRDIAPSELGWQIDAESMARDVGLQGPKAADTFLGHLRYMHEKLGILGKERRARKTYINAKDGAEQIRYKGMDVYYSPTPAFYIPGGYCVVTQDQHKPGGPRLAYDKCENCGGRHLKHYAIQCIDCGYVMYPPAEEDETLPLEKVLRKQNPEHPKMGASGNEYVESITDPHFGVFGNALFSEAEASVPTPEDLQVESTAFVLPLEEQEEGQKVLTPNLGVIVEDSPYDPQVGGSLSEIAQIEEELPTEEQEEALPIALVPQPSLAEMSTLFFSEEAKPETQKPPTPDESYEGPYPPPGRACLPCGLRAWYWSEDEKRYACALHEPVEVQA